MRSARWVALPSALTIVLFVLIALRLNVVRHRTGDWSGENCVIGPYDPAERSYLYMITAVFALTVATAAIVAVRTRSQPARFVGVGVLIVCAVAALYIFVYVWGGLEYNNTPQPEIPCPSKDSQL